MCLPALPGDSRRHGRDGFDDIENATGHGKILELPTDNSSSARINVEKTPISSSIVLYRMEDYLVLVITTQESGCCRVTYAPAEPPAGPRPSKPKALASTPKPLLPPLPPLQNQPQHQMRPCLSRFQPKRLVHHTSTARKSLLISAIPSQQQTA